MLGKSYEIVLFCWYRRRVLLWLIGSYKVKWFERRRPKKTTLSNASLPLSGNRNCTCQWNSKTKKKKCRNLFRYRTHQISRNRLLLKIIVTLYMALTHEWKHLGCDDIQSNSLLLSSLHVTTHRSNTLTFILYSRSPTQVHSRMVRRPTTYLRLSRTSW